MTRWRPFKPDEDPGPVDEEMVLGWAIERGDWVERTRAVLTEAGIPSVRARWGKHLDVIDVFSRDGRYQVQMIFDIGGHCLTGRATADEWGPGTEMIADGVAMAEVPGLVLAWFAQKGVTP